MKLLLAAIVVHAFAASPANSPIIASAPNGESVTTESFNRIELSGSGTVSIVPDAQHRVTLLNGAARSMRVAARSGTLYIECRHPCPNVAEGVVQISAPSVSALHVSGGGTMNVSEGFATARELRVEIQGGGSINASALRAERVAAAVVGGGSAYVSPMRALHARIRRGGDIAYLGEPEIRSDVEDGGSIRRAVGVPRRRSSSFRDPRDGQLYGTVKIGDQLWLDRNLSYLPRVCPAVASNCGIWVYGYDGNRVAEAMSTEEYKRFGALYDWDTAKTTCPPGWHLPSDDEWQALEIALGMSPADAARSGWRGTNQGHAVKSDGTSGLKVTFGGWRTGFGRFNYVGEHANFWCSDEVDEDHACERLVGVRRGDLGRDKGNKGAGFSVRCVQDRRSAFPIRAPATQ